MTKDEKDAIYRRGAIVAIGDLYEDGLLGDGEEVREHLRRMLKAYGIEGATDLCTLISYTPYIEVFRRLFPDMPDYDNE